MAVRTKAELENQINTLLADNTTGAISEGDVRSVFQDIADSLAFATQLRTDAQVNTLADARALLRYTADEKTKLAGVEDSATADQTGAEIVTLLQALTGNGRLNATALRLIADALDTELGSTDWRTGGGGTVTGAQIVTALQALMGDNRLNASALRLIAGALDAELGGTGWRSGGGFFGLGPAQNTFGDTSTADRAAAETLRDTYATNNAAWLTDYNDDLNYLIRLIWSDGTVEQRRNVAGTDWEDLTQLASHTVANMGTPTQILRTLDVNGVVYDAEAVVVPDITTGVLRDPAAADWDATNSRSRTLGFDGVHFLIVRRRLVPEHTATATFTELTDGTTIPGTSYRFRGTHWQDYLVDNPQQDDVYYDRYHNRLRRRNNNAWTTVTGDFVFGQGNYVGHYDSEDDALAHVTADDQWVVYRSGSGTPTMYRVSGFTAGEPEHYEYYWDTLSSGGGVPLTIAQIVTMLEALTGDNRLNATTALRMVAEAIDAELGSTDWRTGRGGTADGVVNGFAFDDDGNVTISRSVGADIEVDISANLKDFMGSRVQLANPTVYTEADDEIISTASFDAEVGDVIFFLTPATIGTAAGNLMFGLSVDGTEMSLHPLQTARLSAVTASDLTANTLYSATRAASAWLLSELGGTTLTAALTAIMVGAPITIDRTTDGQITLGLADDGVTLAHMAANSIDSDQYVNGSIDAVHLAAAVVGRLIPNPGTTMTLTAPGDNTILSVDGSNVDNSAVLRLDVGTTGGMKAFQAGRAGEGLAWASFEGGLGGSNEMPGIALGPGTGARDVRIFRGGAGILRTPNNMVVDGTVSGATPTEDGHLATKAYVDGLVSPTPQHPSLLFRHQYGCHPCSR